MDDLLEHLEFSAKTHCDNKNEFMMDRVDDAWTKLKEYYGKTDETLAYFAATTLNPVVKYTYFKDNWSSGNLLKQFEHKKKQMIELYKTYASRYGPDEPITTQQSDKSPPKRGFWEDRLKPKAVRDKLTRYLNEPVIDDPKGKFHPIDWWRANKQRFPVLSHMAFDILSVPAMSAETERFFSDCKLTITSQRMRMTATTLEAIQLVRSWNNQKFFNLAAWVSLLRS